MEGIEPKKNKLADALKGLEKAMGISSDTVAIEKVSLEESEQMRGSGPVRTTTPKAKRATLEQRYTGAEGFARRNPDN